MAQDENQDLRRLQLAILEIACAFRDICERHQLRYTMVGGTMLGAVRHGGFIPWDDDMDVGMPRPDFERFQEIARRELPEGYALLDCAHDADYLRGFAKLVDTRIKVTNLSNTVETQEYAWLDIFPIDGMPAGRLGQRLHFWRMTFRRFLYSASCFDEMINRNRPGRPLYMRALIRFLAVTHFGRGWDTKKLLMWIERGLKRYPYDECDTVISFYGQYMLREIMPKSLLGVVRPYPFEDTQLDGPAEYDAYLTHLYGDYMTPPEGDQRHKLNLGAIEYQQEEGDEP